MSWFDDEFFNNPDWGWNKYEELAQYQDYPIVGPIYKTRMRQLEQAERQRIMDDRLNSWGINKSKSKYPISDYLSFQYGNSVGYDDYITATEGVIDSFSILRGLYKW